MRVAYTAIILFLTFSVCTTGNIPALSMTFSVAGGCDEPILEWNGDLTHTDNDNIDESFEKHRSVSVRDFIAETTFYNPYSSSEGKWDYGFLLSISVDINYAIRVTSDGEWEHIQLIEEGKRSLDQGTVALQRGADQSNDLRIIAVGDSGAFYVNGQFVTELNTSGERCDVRVGTGINRNYVISGRVTRCENFRVWSLDTPSSGPSSGSLEDKKDDSPVTFPTDISVRDFIAEATFYNPNSSSEGKWDYGFLFRKSEDGKMYEIRVTSDGEWIYVLKIGEKRTNIGQNKFNLHTGANQKNHLRIIVIGKQGWFFVNGEFERRLSIGELTDIGSIDIAAGIVPENETEGETTRFEDFTVWSLDGCPQLPVYEARDRDRDGIIDDEDRCNNPDCDIVDADGCPLDSDGDGMDNCKDECRLEYGPRSNNGCPVDNDNDGITDDNDTCYNPDCNIVDANGCPSDSDSDGVIDCEDECPSDYGDQDFGGCPSTDTDNDGVPDSRDACDIPGCTPEDVDADGCPTDSDSDGVNDCEDECPGLKGLALSNGCPLPLYLYVIPLVLIAAILITGVIQKKRKGQEKKPEKGEDKPRKATCPFCKNEIEEEWISCPYCGIKIKEDTQAY